MIQKAAAKKPPILMVHGAFAGGWAFEKFQDYFEGLGYPCVAPDLRYHNGANGRPVAPELSRTSLLHYVSDLEALIGTLRCEPILMGHSMGGLLCQMLAARGHGSALIMLAPSPPAGVIPASALEMLTSFGIFASGMGWGLNALSPDRNATALHALAHIPELPKKAILDRLSPESGYALFEIMCWMMDPQQASRVDVSKMKLPVLAAVGGHDTINRPDTVRQIAQRYGGRAEFQSFDEVGHWLLDGPGWQDIAEYCQCWMERSLAPFPA